MVTYLTVFNSLNLLNMSYGDQKIICFALRIANNSIRAILKKPRVNHFSILYAFLELSEKCFIRGIQDLIIVHL